jgi:exodeoxyribonuclease VII large subunit
LIGPAHQVDRRRDVLNGLGRELIRRRKERLSALIGMLQQRDPREVLRTRERSLEECRRRLARDYTLLRDRLGSGQLHINELRDRLAASAQRGLRERHAALESRAGRLSALGPEQTLRRGYSICVDGADGTIIREAAQTSKGRPINVRLGSGRLGARVEETMP